MITLNNYNRIVLLISNAEDFNFYSFQEAVKDKIFDR